MHYKNTAKYIVLTLGNLVFFYYLYLWFQSNIHWDSFIKAFFEIPLSAIFTVLLLGISTLGFYAERLSCLIGKKRDICFWVVSFGFGANNIFPFRIGDILKLFFARKYFHISAAKLLFVKVMEKFFDLSALLVIGALAVLLFGAVAVKHDYLVWIAAFLVACLGITFMAVAIMQSESKWVKAIRKNNQINDICILFHEVISNPAIKRSLYATVIIWVVTVFMMYMYYRLTLQYFQVGLYDVLSLVFLTTMSFGIPAAPGGVGLFEAAIVFYLTKFVGVPTEKSLATALVLHFLLAFPQIIFMLFAIIKANLIVVPKPPL